MNSHLQWFGVKGSSSFTVSVSHCMTWTTATLSSEATAEWSSPVSITIFEAPDSSSFNYVLVFQKFGLKKNKNVLDYLLFWLISKLVLAYFMSSWCLLWGLLRWALALWLKTTALCKLTVILLGDWLPAEVKTLGACIVKERQDGGGVNIRVPNLGPVT